MPSSRSSGIVLVALLGLAPLTLAAQEKSLPEQIADVMVQLNGGVHPGFRFAHAKGLIVTGHAASEEPGMRWLAPWLEQRFPGVPATFIHTGSAFQTL